MSHSGEFFGEITVLSIFSQVQCFLFCQLPFLAKETLSVVSECLLTNWIVSSRRFNNMQDVIHSFFRFTFGPHTISYFDTQFHTGTRKRFKNRNPTNLRPTDWLDFIVTTAYIFSAILLPNPIDNQTSETVSKVVNSTLTKHLYPPTELLPNTRTEFRSELVGEQMSSQGYREILNCRSPNRTWCWQDKRNFTRNFVAIRRKKCAHYNGKEDAHRLEITEWCYVLNARFFIYQSIKVTSLDRISVLQKRSPDFENAVIKMVR